jgi:hypothetical protein
VTSQHSTTDDLSRDCPAGLTRQAVLVGLLVLAACLVARVWLIDHTVVIAKDGTVYVEMARTFDRTSADPQASLSGAVRDYDYHPGYPAVVVFVNRLIGPRLSDDPAEAWDLSGQWISLVAGVLGTAAVWCLSGMLFGWRTAWIGPLLFGLSRKWATLGADVLSDALAVCLGLWAVVLAVMVVRRLHRGGGWTVLLAAACGLLAGAGYLVRPEIAIVAAVAALAWIVQAVQGRAKWGTTLAAAAAVLLVTVNIALPYVLAIGKLTGKKSFALFIPGLLFAAAVVALAAIGRRKGRLAVFHSICAMLGMTVIGVICYAAVTGWEGVFWIPKGLFEWISELQAATHAIVAAAAVVGLVVLLLKPLWPTLAADPLVPDLRPGATVLLICLQASLLVVLVALYKQAGYISDRHLMLTAAVFVPLAGVGASSAAALVVRIGRDLHLPTFPRATLMVVVLAAATFTTIRTLRPLHEDHGTYRQAAGFVARRSEVVLANSAYIAHYGHRSFRRIPVDDEGRIDLVKLSRMARQNRSPWLLVLSRRDSEAIEPLLTSGDVREVIRFLLRPGGSSKSDVFVFSLGGRP